MKKRSSFEAINTSGNNTAGVSAFQMGTTLEKDVQNNLLQSGKTTLLQLCYAKKKGNHPPRNMRLAFDYSMLISLRSGKRQT